MTPPARLPQDWTPPMNTDDLIAIDIHTHAEVSCWNPFDNYGEEYDRAADKYFGSNRRPTIAETVAYYRERRIGLVMFTVDSESKLGRRRIPNEEICEAAKANSDMMIAFAFSAFSAVHAKAPQRARVSASSGIWGASAISGQTPHATLCRLQNYRWS